MVTSTAIGDEVVTTKKQYDVPIGTLATVKEVFWVDLERAGDVKFCVGIVFPDHIYDKCEISKDRAWAYYNTEIEIVEEK